ncbi:hypothetical protein VB711_19665 [Cronbergia sp. UHCC 0137]|uniref:hypothetical protein n=1 Tax=Cronbergia sp. UHCC 0137 TaxID=3110239 RepID=UPI002B1F3558|nr:hypothetical protein [Cronbergia sp. UHCC 0137]MEA5620046.1 hypothetical protein [Cronbergia sp. UHCC 0137]
MLNKKNLLGSLAGLILITSSTVSATMPDSHSEQINQFHQIEQPLALKIAVTVGGLGLIGLELWWFLFNKLPVGKREQGTRERDNIL